MLTFGGEGKSFAGALLVALAAARDLVTRALGAAASLLGSFFTLDLALGGALLAALLVLPFALSCLQQEKQV